MTFKKILFLVLLTPVLCYGEELSGEETTLLSHPYSALPEQVSADTAAVHPAWYKERLEYEIYWGLIYVGSAYLEVDRIVTITGRPAYHIISGARSAAFINNFYSVSDINESWLDAAEFYSRGYYKKIKEGGYFVNEWVVFDNESGRFYGEKLNKKRHRSPVEGVLEGHVNDVLSSLYLMRAINLTPETQRVLTINTKKNWQMSVKLRKREKASTAYGKFKCIVLEPQLGDDGLFVAKKGKKMLIWVTDDELRLPLILKAEIFIGSVTAKLVKRRLK